MYLVYWVPTYLLLAAIAYLAARGVLGLFIAQDSPNAIWRAIRVATDPILRLLRPLTPSFIVEPLVPLVAAGWLLLAWLIYREALLWLGWGAGGA
jgi:uncharacterized protein YggT (Ycf19 family)